MDAFDCQMPHGIAFHAMFYKLIEDKRMFNYLKLFIKYNPPINFKTGYKIRKQN